MTTRRPYIYISAAIFALVLTVFGLRVAADSLPAQLTDQEFWKLSSDFSEADGFFRSDNLLSNEIWMQRVIPELLSNIKSPSVYMGVGPEQNFTYITSLKPKMVFIVDVRRGNLDLQLTYKALFELSNDRVDFVGRLFSKKRPEGLDRNSSALEIFSKYREVETSEELYKENLKAIEDLSSTSTTSRCRTATARASSTSITRSTTSARSSITRRPADSVRGISRATPI